MAIYKINEFEIFIKTIEEAQTKHWSQIARALGVDKNTISAWKKLPQAQKSISKGIVNAFDEMERAGKNDWRMWEAKLKMLGVSDRFDESAVTQINPIEELLIAYGILDSSGNKIDD